MHVAIVIPRNLYQSDLAWAVDTCVYSTKWRAPDEHDRMMLGGVIVPAYDFRFNYHSGLPVLLLPIHDNTPVPVGCFAAAVAFHQAFHPTLVHCHAGQSRSVAFAAAIASRQGVDYEEVYRLCGSRPTKTVHESLMAWLDAGG